MYALSQDAVVGDEVSATRRVGDDVIVWGKIDGRAVGWGKGTRVGLEVGLVGRAVGLVVKSVASITG